MDDELEELLRRADELLMLSSQIQRTSHDVSVRVARVFESHDRLSVQMKRMNTRKRAED